MHQTNPDKNTTNQTVRTIFYDQAIQDMETILTILREIPDSILDCRFPD